MDDPDDDTDVVHKPGQKWPSADVAYKDGYQHGYYAAQKSNPRKGKTMEGIASDKVNIHVGGGEGRADSGLNAAVAMAALGNRNEKDISPLIMAALGNRNEGHRNDDGFGFGGGAMGMLLMALLFGRRGLGGGDDCGNDEHGRTAILQTLMEGQADLRAQVPTSALEIQNQVCSAISQLALGVQQGLANNKDAFQNGLLAQLAAIAGVKDAVQNGFTITNNNILEGFCKVVTANRDDGDKTRAQIALYHEGTLQRELAVAQSALAEERGARRIRDVEFNVTNQNTNTALANAQQSQQQLQFQTNIEALFSRLLTGFTSIANQTMLARQAQDIVNLGTMTASGTQAAANTQVR